MLHMRVKMSDVLNDNYSWAIVIVMVWSWRANWLCSGRANTCLLLYLVIVVLRNFVLLPVRHILRKCPVKSDDYCAGSIQQLTCTSKYVHHEPTICTIHTIVRLCVFNQYSTSKMMAMLLSRFACHSTHYEMLMWPKRDVSVKVTMAAMAMLT